jgi:hypothetical protein
MEEQKQPVTEISLLIEIRDLLLETDKKTEYQNKLFEEMYLAKEEGDRTRKDMMEGPMSIISSLLEQTTLKMPDGENKQKLEDLQGVFHKVRGVTK